VRGLQSLWDHQCLYHGWAILNYGYSQALCDLLWLGHKDECRYLLLDCDAPPTELLPQFEWEEVAS
jgi:hypothetical protein